MAKKSGDPRKRAAAQQAKHRKENALIDRGTRAFEEKEFRLVDFIIWRGAKPNFYETHTARICLMKLEFCRPRTLTLAQLLAANRDDEAFNPAIAAEVVQFWKENNNG